MFCKCYLVRISTAVCYWHLWTACLLILQNRFPAKLSSVQAKDEEQLLIIHKWHEEVLLVLASIKVFHIAYEVVQTIAT
jgi:hypothetical protein